MAPRPLQPTEVTGRASGAGGAAEWLAALDRALAGVGAALLPVPGPQLAPAAVGAQLVDAMRPEVPLDDAAVALVVPTSGSTGVPKGALLSAAAIRASAAATRARLGGPGHWVLALPLTHVAGLMVLARSLDSGTEPSVVDLSNGFDPAAFAAVTQAARGPGLLFTSLVPAQLALLLDADVDLRPYDGILLGGAAAPAALLARARAAGATVVTTYGMSETCGGCVYDGVPLDGVQANVDDAGLIRLGGPTVFSGYRLQPELTIASLVDGAFRTSDVGRFADGRLTVLGRADAMVVSGGVNVPADWVAAVLAEHPGVRDVAVVGVDHAVWGQRVVAAVVPSAAPGPTLAALRAFAGRRLEPAAVPRDLVLLDALPLLPSGKLDRETLGAVVSAALTADAASNPPEER